MTEDAIFPLPSVTASIWDSLASTVEVHERTAISLVARRKKAATRGLQKVAESADSDHSRRYS